MIIHVKNTEMSLSLFLGVIFAFCECRTVKGYLKFVQDSDGNERKQRESPCKRETEWRAGALWSYLVWLMWLCLVCCVVSKSTRAWTPPSPWHAHWLAMIISPASPPLALSSWGTYSITQLLLPSPIVLGPRNPKSWMSPGIAGPITDSPKQNDTLMRWRCEGAEIREHLWIMHLKWRVQLWNHKTKPLPIFMYLLISRSTYSNHFLKFLFSLIGYILTDASFLNKPFLNFDYNLKIFNFFFAILIAHNFIL